MSPTTALVKRLGEITAQIANLANVSGDVPPVFSGGVSTELSRLENERARIVETLRLAAAVAKYQSSGRWTGSHVSAAEKDAIRPYRTTQLHPLAVVNNIQTR